MARETEGVRALTAAVLATTLLTASFACSASAEGDAHLGTEGASCLRTPDCAPPLQCVENVCGGPGSGGADASGGGGGSDVFAPPLQTDIRFGGGPDGAGEAPDGVSGAPDLAAAPDVLYQPFDVGPDWTPVGPDVHVVAPDTYTGCGELGVESDWSGRFDGTITFWDVQAPPGLEGQVPESGVLHTYGDLNFEIRCLEQKLIVVGVLSGFGEAEGELGSHPFEAQLSGEFNPIDRTMEATLDGDVRLFFIFQIFFEGILDGELVSSERFEGTWSGEATGNNLDLEGEAMGGGQWWALAE